MGIRSVDCEIHGLELAGAIFIESTIRAAVRIRSPHQSDPAFTQYVCHMHDLGIYHDALQTHFGYNESVS